MSAQGDKIGRRKFLRADDGSITVETVVMFPLILAALAFSFEFGRMFIAHHTLVNNVRAVERYIARCDDPQNDPCATAVENIIQTGVPSGGSLPAWATSIDIVGPTFTTISGTNFRVDDDVIRIGATGNFQFLIASFFGGNNGTIPISVVEDIRHSGD